MTDNLHARPLEMDQLDKAFALIQLAFQDVSLERWRCHVRESLDGNGDSAGWIAIEDDKGYIHGLVAYRIQPDLVCGRTLVSEEIILAGVALTQASACVIEGLTQLAWRTGCEAIHIMPSADQDDALDRGRANLERNLVKTGFIDHGGHFCFRRTGICRR